MTFSKKTHYQYPISNIEEVDNFYVLDGCLKLLKDQEKGQEKIINGKLQQSYTNSYVYVSPGTKRTVTYKIDSSIPSSGSNNWSSNIDAAMIAYNSIRNFNITFQKITSGSADITFSGGYFSSTAIAWGSWTSSGNPGTSVTINFNYSGNILGSQRTFVMAHEVGHNLGFRHTNWIAAGESLNNPSAGLYGGNLVPATFGSDPYTIMNTGPSYPSVPNWTDFPYTDLLAIRYLYSYDASEKPFYSYLKTSTGGYNWTTNWNTYQYGASGFSYWGVNGYIYSSQKSGTVPLYRYRHNVTHVDYLSRDSNLGATYPGYVLQATAGYVYTANSSGRMPVYEWYHPDKGFYFTTLTSDSVTSSGGWSGGSIAFYTLTLDAN